MKLYEISEMFHDLMDMFDNGEIDAHTLMDTLAGIDFDFENKVRNCLMIRQQLIGNSAAMQAEINRLKVLQKQSEKNAESIEEYVKLHMIGMQKDKVDLGIFKVTLRAPSKAVSVVDESKIPDQYWRVIPESRQVDKSALQTALKLGAVDGAELVDGKRSLIIK